MKETIIRVKKNYVNKLRKGYPLIEKDALMDNNKLKKEGMILRLVDEQHRFIAKGYYGKQNKGNGWVLHDEKNTSIDIAFFKKTLKKAIDYRHKMYQQKDTNAFRVFNGEGDGIGGMTIDYYAGYYLIQWYSQGIYTFRTNILDVLKELVDYKGIYEKKRFNKGGQYIDDDDFVCGERAKMPIVVQENGVNFAVYLNEGAMVGFFLDQRDVRQAIRDHYAKGKKVLNTFSYTGAFSVFAALGGAIKTTSVDLANRSRAKTREQFMVNHVNPDDHDMIVEDIFHYFKYAIKKKLLFDMVILDPPSFAKSKKFTFSAAKDYTDLLKQTIAITQNQGIILASTNCSTFNIEQFKDMIHQAFIESNHTYNILETFSLPYDFRLNDHFKEGNYLKVVLIQKKR